MGRYELGGIYFISKEHRQRLLEILLKDNTINGDVERLSLFYIISSSEDIYNKFKNKLYNFNQHWIEPEGLGKIDLSSSQRKLVYLGFNLYNNYYDDEQRLTVLDTFIGLDIENLKVALEGIKIRVGH